ncbi:MAG: hypothetical protein CMK32_06290 [Porticoccaceae bacterium]|nr:hypothetical protein [Porticoccaceae bacterium]
MGNDNYRLQESLSALVDDEAGELEVRRLLKAVGENPELRGRWQRYQLISASMRKELPAGLVDLSARISEAVDEQHLESPRRLQKLLEPLGKVAIAASVAVAAVFGVQQLPGYLQGGAAVSTDSVAAPSVAATSPQFQLPAGVDLPPVSARLASSESKYAIEPRPVTIMPQVQPDLATQIRIQAYLNSMMKRHTQGASMHTSQGMMPYARLPHEISDAP